MVYEAAFGVNSSMENEQTEPSSIPLLDLAAIPRDIMLLGKRLADTKYQIDMLG